MAKNNLPFTVVYEDDRIIAVNKASGIAVGGDRWEPDEVRLDRLVAGECLAGEKSSPGGENRLFTVHRIDKDTSGLVIFAKDSQTHRALSLAFENRLAGKEYLAVVHGRPLWKEEACCLPLVPNGDKLHRTIIDNYRGKPSRTAFTLRCAVGNYSVIEARPETGRTHQIRVHLASLGHPVVCDPLYGKSAGRSIEKGICLSSFKKNWRGDPATERPLVERLALHAARLILPGFGRDGGDLDLAAPLPRDLGALVKQMEKCGRPA
jgi:RluA family pseudouridine synthase